MTEPQKDHGKALVITALSGLLILGIGHLYVGRFGRGVALIGASCVLFAVGFAGGFAMFYDALAAAMVTAALVAGVPLYFLQLYDVHRITRRPPAGQPSADE